MSVPGRVDAAALLLSLDPPAWFLRHARAVAEVAAWLAARCLGRGARVDSGLVEAAALLHDIDKLLPVGDPARRLPHGEGSADWLARQGHPELGGAVAAHPVTRLAGVRDWPAWLATSAAEERVVAYADKRAGQRLEPMAARFQSWARRYPEGWPDQPPGLVWTRALALETSVCGLAGVKPTDVRRLSWTGRALAAARDEIAGGRLPTTRHRMTSRGHTAARA